MKITSAIWFALGLSWQVQAADENTTVYYWIDAQGVTHFSDRPVAGKTMNSKQVEIIKPRAGRQSVAVGCAGAESLRNGSMPVAIPPPPVES